MRISDWSSDVCSSDLPIDGRIGRAMVTEGNLAQADQTLLTTLVSQDPMYVYFESDEQTYLRYAELARAGKRPRSSNPVRIGLATETGFPHEGTVDFVDNKVDPPTGPTSSQEDRRDGQE